MIKDKIKILIADDHDLIRQGLKMVLTHEPDFIIAGEAQNGKEVLEMLPLYHPDVLLIDMNMPTLSGLDVLREVREKKISVKVLFLTIENDKHALLEAIEMGADGYVLKGSSTLELVEAIRRVCADENYIDRTLVSLLFNKVHHQERNNKSFDELSGRELDILYHMSQGRSNKVIAELLFVSEKTVKNYATRIFRKLDVNDRVQATIFAIEHDFSKYYELSSDK